MISLTELLSSRGFRNLERTKIVRHQDHRVDMRMLRRRGLFEFYQRTQAKDVFNCDQIVSFIGDENRRAIFCGIFGVDGKRQIEPGARLKVPPGFPVELLEGATLLYELRELSGFEALEDRVVIDWGDAPLSWAQWYKDREIVEVLPAGYVMDWPGYHQVRLAFQDLRAIAANEAANREWVRRLSSVAGVYCILHTRTGELYIGAACGKEGLWGRWRTYASTVHGGNVLLQSRSETVAGFADDLVFSILQTLPSGSSKDEVVAAESCMKEKLGARAFGLNAN
ncbi:MAG: GIY-YIG nuclease family protein [Anaeromyxobacter sp.]